MSRGNILLGVSGSIAAFKAAALASKLVKEGFTVQVAATSSALKFVGEATFEGLTGRPVFADIFARGQMMEHIHLARWADLLIVAPASAATLNRMAYGIAEDPITTLYLAIERHKPVLIAPAMNSQMYAHPAVQEALVRLRGFEAKIIEPGEGLLACGESGQGRMAEPEELLAEILAALAATPENSEACAIDSVRSTATEETSPRGRILITSGGTREYIDGVRTLTNFSTGQTGAALADAFIESGFAVTYLHAKNSVMPKSSGGRLRTESFDTYSDLEGALSRALKSEEYDAVVHLAAVSDFSVDKIGVGDESLEPSREIKLGSEKAITLHLRRNPKLITELKKWSKNSAIKVIAYKLTNTSNVIERSQAISRLLDNENVDYVVHNDLSEITETAHPFRVYGDTGFTRTGKTKAEMARALIDIMGAEL